MQPQQQQQQTPPNQQQVPDHRLNELMERIRQLELQNTQLRTTVDFVTKGNKQQQPPQESAFKPDVEKALVDIIRRELNPFQEQVKNQVGLVFDATDEAKFRLQYSDPKYAKYHAKVDQMRKEYEAQGRWIPREEALRIVYFEETGKKAAGEPQAPAAQPQPKFDPYFGTMVDPTTGLPMTAEQMKALQPPAEPDQFGQQPPPQQVQQPWPQQQPQPQQQWTQAPQNQGYPPGGQRPGHNLNPNHPMANPFGLPSQGVNQPAPAQRQAAVPTQISLESSDADLEAFADKFGDIPL